MNTEPGQHATRREEFYPDSEKEKTGHAVRWR